MAQAYGRVVIVHDEPAFTSSLTKAFRALGFVTDIAIDCQTAIRRIAQNPPDVVCVGLNLPRDSGYDLCELIRRNPDLDHVQILVISDRDSPEVIAYAEEAGANAFLKRPFKRDQLAAYVTTMVEMRKRSRSDTRFRHTGDGLTLE
jgi:DNA-binding response OmpR family regulator